MRTGRSQMEIVVVSGLRHCASSRLRRESANRVDQIA